MSMSSHLLQRAIQWSRAGNKDEARALLRALIQKEPGNQLAWFWYADTLASDDERIAALEQFLLLNPGNTAARKALATMYVRRDLGLVRQPLAARPSLSPPPRERPHFDSYITKETTSSTAPTQPVRTVGRRPIPVRQAAVDKDAKGIQISYRMILFLLLIPLYLFVGWAVFMINSTPSRTEFETLSGNYSSLVSQHASLQQDYNNLTRAAVNILAEREALKKACSNQFPSDFPPVNLLPFDDMIARCAALPPVYAGSPGP